MLISHSQLILQQGWINDRNVHECNSLASAHAGKELLKVGISESAPSSNPLLIDFRKTSFVSEQYKSSLGFLDEVLSSSGDFTFKKYLHVGKVHNKLPQRKHLQDGLLSGGSPLTKNTSNSKYNLSSGSSTQHDLYHNSRNLFGYDRRAVDHNSRNLFGYFSHHDSNRSYSLSSALWSVCFSPSIHKFSVRNIISWIKTFECGET